MLLLENFIGYIQSSVGAEYIWILMLVSVFALIGIVGKYGGISGLYIYIVIAIIGGNLQVLKAVEFKWYVEPLPLGTVLFASTYLCTDIINEVYGERAARRGVMLGLLGYILWVIICIFTLLFPPISQESNIENYSWAIENHVHLMALFTPVGAFFVASQVSYLVSQLLDVRVFSHLRKKEGSLWLRNCISTSISSLVDSIIFSILAWKVFGVEDISWRIVIVSYIFGTWILRLVIAVIDTPFCYLGVRLVRGRDDVQV